MSLFQVTAVLLTLAAVFAYVNHRWLQMPAAIGLMAMSLAASVALIVVDRIGLLPLAATAGRVLEHVDFNATLLHGMLGALLFAGALHVDVRELRRELATVSALSIGGTIASSFLVGGLYYALHRALGSEIELTTCFLFGALISPTDPVAVLGVLKAARVPKSLEIQIAGESLLNDGVGVVVFATLLGVMKAGGAPSLGSVLGLFLREAVGGIVFGLATGYVAFRLLASIDHYQTELLVTLALVLGGYAAAEQLHVSAPLASVASGLLIGNRGRAHAMSDVTRDHLDKFWMLIDEVLNAVLFVLVGLEVVRIPLSTTALVLGALSIIVVLAGRVATVALPIALLQRASGNVGRSVAVLTWGGLRGGISVALALSVPMVTGRHYLVSSTYVVVVFSILVQGLTLGRLVRRFGPDVPSSTH